MLKRCIICNKEFEAKRDSAKFCSAVCQEKFAKLSGTKRTPKPANSGDKNIDSVNNLSI